MNKKKSNKKKSIKRINTKSITRKKSMKRKNSIRRKKSSIKRIDGFNFIHSLKQELEERETYKKQLIELIKLFGELSNEDVDEFIEEANMMSLEEIEKNIKYLDNEIGKLINKSGKKENKKDEELKLKKPVYKPKGRYGNIFNLNDSFNYNLNNSFDNNISSFYNNVIDDDDVIINDTNSIDNDNNDNVIDDDVIINDTNSIDNDNNDNSFKNTTSGTISPIGYESDVE